MKREMSDPNPCTCWNNEQCLNIGENVYGQVFSVVCFNHKIVTPQSKNVFQKIPHPYYPIGVIGISRAGKSTTMSEFSKYVNQKSNPSAPPIEEFVASNGTAACTHGIHVVALPRVQDGNPAGTYLIYDAEGQEAGSTLNHTKILAVLSRITTQLAYLEASQFNYAAVRSLGQLIASGIIINDGLSEIDWPHLSIVVNKYALAPPQPNHATWIANELAENPFDNRNNQDREAIRNTWLNQNKLDYYTIPIDMSVVQTGVILPEEVTAAFKKVVGESRELLFKRLVERCQPLSMNSVAGKEGKEELLYGKFFVDVLEALLQIEQKQGSYHLKTALQIAIMEEAKLAKEDAYNVYLTFRTQYSLQFDNSEVCGAKGTTNDDEAAQIRNNVFGRHNQLSSISFQKFDEKTSKYRGYGCDEFVGEERKNLDHWLNERWREIGTHFDHQRSINHTRTYTEPGIEDGPRFERVHHIENEQVLFHTITHYFWASYVHRWATSRVHYFRYNGDEIIGNWTRVGDASEIMIGGPWHGPAP